MKIDLRNWPEQFRKLFTRTCLCGSKKFFVALEDIDMIPLSLPAEQRVTCIECGRYSIQTVSAEGQVKAPEKDGH